MEDLETYKNLTLFELPQTHQKETEEETDLSDVANQKSKYIQETLELFPKVKTLKAKKRT